MKILFFAILLSLTSSSFAYYSLGCDWQVPAHEYYRGAASIELKGVNREIILDKNSLKNMDVSIAGNLPHEVSYLIRGNNFHYTTANTGTPSLSSFNYNDPQRRTYIFENSVLDKNNKITVGYYSLDDGRYTAVVKNVEFKFFIDKKVHYKEQDYMNVPSRIMKNVARLVVTFKDQRIVTETTCDLGSYGE